MTKTLKTVPQKEKASSSRPSDDKAPVEPSVLDYVPGPCTLKIDFKVENPSSVPGRCEHVSMYMCSITEGHLEAVNKDCNWGSEVVLQIPSPEKSVITHVEGCNQGRLLRPSSGEEGTKSPIPKPGKDKKRKAASRSEGPKPKTRRVRRKAIALSIDSVQRLREEEENAEEENAEEEGASALVQQKVEKIGSLREEVDQIKAECNRRKETIDRLAAKKETILTKLLSADVQLRRVKKKGSAQAKRIEELETRLTEAKAEVESSKVIADKSIAVYRADAEVAQIEAREAADTADARAHWVAELAKCQLKRLANWAIL
ncbi:uncharacterized protein [Nicotiana tomentosiformis]|uniref:uncharacterized protein n=1 Tax=Nicotiana tomentosiformis TaxID=4098 RepID=UPI00388C5DBC